MTGARFERAGAVLECTIVPWDTEIFGFPVAQIDRLELGGGGEAAAADAAAQAEGTTELLEAFDGWCAEQEVRLASCRLDHLRLRESMALEERGFRFIETVYRPRLDSLDGIAAPRHALDVDEATAADIDDLAGMAHDAFTTGRYRLDWRLPSELNDRRYATWLRSSAGDPDRQVLKAAIDGEPVGFFVVEHRPDRSVYWHLTAVAPRWQGQGVGMSLWQTMLLRHRAEGATFVETTISGHNLPVINLYGRLGFSFASAQMTFHRVRDVGR